MPKEATNPKPSMQIEWHCIAVHKHTHECTLEYMGAEKQTTEKVGFRQFIDLRMRLLHMASMLAFLSRLRNHGYMYIKWLAHAVLRVIDINTSHVVSKESGSQQGTRKAAMS